MVRIGRLVTGLWFTGMFTGLMVGGGCALLFPVDAGDSLAHFGTRAPQVGDMAPNVTLRDLTGNTVDLHQLIGKQPIVIQLGSYTCPVFRYRRFDMQKLYEEFSGRVTFLVLYTLEAHPNGVPSPYREDSGEEWVPWINRVSRVKLNQTQSLKQRTSHALFAQQRMQSSARFLVDPPTNYAWQTYGQAPSAAFLIDQQGRIVLRQPWIVPKDIKSGLEQLLSPLG